MTADLSLTDRVHGSAGLARRRAAARTLIRAMSRLTVDGLDEVPVDGPLVFNMNHRSLVDGPLLFGAVGRPVNFLVKREAFTPVIGAILRSAAQIPVVRGAVDPAPVRLCLDVLRAGGAVGIYPEGTRGDGLVRAVRPGAAYLALRSGARVVPVAACGTAATTHRRSWRRPEVRLAFGAPRDVVRHPDATPLSRRTVAELSERLRVDLAELVARTDEAADVAAAEWEQT